MASVTPAATSPDRENNGYGIYVIELDERANRHFDLPLDLPLPVVYVGQSWHSPEHRFRQHMKGVRLASKVVTRYGVRLRPDLYRHLARVETRPEAEDLEASHARTLARLGFHAYFDKTLVRPGEA